MTEWLLTQEEGEKRVYEYMVEEGQMFSVERGHWEQLVPVLANA